MDEIRYSRQIMLDELGYNAQEKICNAKIAIAGAGGLGTPIAQRLVAMGVGTIVIIDRDKIEKSNLHRQVLYRDTDIGKKKVDVMAERLGEINPDCNIIPVGISLNYESTKTVIQGVDLVIDGLDNVTARYDVNQACIDTNIPLVSAGAVGQDGQCITVIPGESACFACVYPALDDSKMPSCGLTGVHPSILGIVGDMAASEAIRVITGQTPKLKGKILHCNLDFDFMKTIVTKVEDCHACGTKKTIQIQETRVEEMCSREIGKRTFAVTPGVLNNDIIEGDAFYKDIKLSFTKGGGCIIIGADSVEHAREIYDKSVKTLKENIIMF